MRKIEYLSLTLITCLILVFMPARFTHNMILVVMVIAGIEFVRTLWKGE